MAEQYDPNTDISGSIKFKQQFFFEEKPHMAAIMNAIASELQELSDAIYDVMTEIDVNSAVGAQLDLLGKIYGRSRDGYGDEAYRSLLKMQIGINVSNGTINPMIAIIKSVTDSTKVDMFEDYPAAVSAVVNGGTVNAELLAELESVASAGVDMSIRPIGGDDAFGFENSFDSLGFSSLYDPTSGGQYVAHIEV